MKNKALVMVIVAVVALVAVYFLFFRKKGTESAESSYKTDACKGKPAGTPCGKCRNRCACDGEGNCLPCDGGLNQYWPCSANPTQNVTSSSTKHK